MKSNDIDLHGKFYNDLELTLENHFYNNEPPFKIITSWFLFGFSKRILSSSDFFIIVPKGTSI